MIDRWEFDEDTYEVKHDGVAIAQLQNSDDALEAAQDNDLEKVALQDSAGAEEFDQRQIGFGNSLCNFLNEHEFELPHQYRPHSPQPQQVKRKKRK